MVEVRLFRSNCISSSPLIELMTSTTDSWLSITIFRPVVSRKGSLLGFLSVLHPISLVLSSELSGSLLSSTTVLVSLSLIKSTAESGNCLHKLVVGMSLWMSKMPFSPSERLKHVFTYLTQNIVFFQNTPTQSHDCSWRKLWKKTEWVSKSVVSLLQSYVSKNGGSGMVHLLVIWDPNVQHQAVNNAEAISEPEQLTNACAGCHVRKHGNMWPVNDAWNSNYIFIRDLTAKCQGCVNYVISVTHTGWFRSSLPNFVHTSHSDGEFKKKHWVVMAIWK